jgi:hypothetical protein
VQHQSFADWVHATHQTSNRRAATDRFAISDSARSATRGILQPVPAALGFARDLCPQVPDRQRAFARTGVLPTRPGQ